MPSRTIGNHATRAIAAALLTALVALVPSGTALARQGVYAGSTKAGDPIVITTDARGKKITGAVFRVRVDSTDDWWAAGTSAKVRATAIDPDRIPLGTLFTTQNGHGRFAGLVAVQASGDPTMLVSVNLAGSLKPRKATGTLKASVVDSQTHSAVASGTRIKWTARRAAGRIYGGSTAARLPIVITVDRAHRKVTELGLSCYTDDTAPPGYWASNEWLMNFPIKSGRFGENWSEPDGTTMYDWNLAGRIGSKSVTGTFRLWVRGLDTDGTAWRATMPMTKYTAATG